MDAAPLSLSDLPSSFIIMMLQSMSLDDRFTCALVCKAWAEAATAATRSIILSDEMEDLSSLQAWLEKHGGQLEVLQLHVCPEFAKLTALPCAQLHDLLLKGGIIYDDDDSWVTHLYLDSRVWSDIAEATKLTSLSLQWVNTHSQQADVVSALTALPDLEQLTWSGVVCGRHATAQRDMTDSKLLQKRTKLMALNLCYVETADPLVHLGVLTRLQELRLFVAHSWAPTDCPGLQELKALTRLQLHGFGDIPPSVSQFTALQQLDVGSRTTPTALNELSALTGLVHLGVKGLGELAHDFPPLQLPGLQRLEVLDGSGHSMPMSYLACCTQLRALVVGCVHLSGPGSLVASSMLQHLELKFCRVSAADEATDLASWQQVFPGPGQLPHLTSLKLTNPRSAPKHADMECVVACCSSLQVLHLDSLSACMPSTLTRLSGLTSLDIRNVSDEEYSSLSQLTGLRELRVVDASRMFTAGLQQLAALEQLTSLGFIFLGVSSDVFREHMSDKLPGPAHTEYGIINKVRVYVDVYVGKNDRTLPTMIGTHFVAFVSC